MDIKAVIIKYSQRSEESNKALVSIKASIEELKQKVNKSTPEDLDEHSQALESKVMELIVTLREAQLYKSFLEDLIG